MVLVLESKGVVYTRGLGSWPIEPHDAPLLDETMENPWDMAQIFPPTLFFRKKGKYDFFKIFFLGFKGQQFL